MVFDVSKRCRTLTALALFLLAPGLTHAQSEAQRSLTRVTGDVYRFQNNNHVSLAVVTGDGVVVVDPINAGASSWLRQELTTVTDQPVTHLIYSHSHLDHASGGGEFAGATVVMHENAPETVDGAAPDIRFAERLEVAVGGKTFELSYIGPGHGTDMIATVVRPENVAFIVDVASVRRLPYRDFPGSDVDAWIDQVRAVEALDFETFVGGHGPVGTKADATAARVYMENLRNQVLAGLRAGKSVGQLAEDVTMDDYRDWQAYEDWRELNVQGMARFLTESGQVN